MTSSRIKRVVAIVHYNRPKYLNEIFTAVRDTVPEGTRIVVCDDGSQELPVLDDAIVIKGKNLGVSANKNRALWAAQDAHYICIIEDDLKPTQKGWFEAYEKAANLSGINHFCRVQDRYVQETELAFAEYMKKHDLTPIYGPSPRGDLTFITRTVLDHVGGFNPKFRGAGYAHGEWSHRVQGAGLIGHNNKWVDIKEACDTFVQVGDREGGRWQLTPKELKKQLSKNEKIYKELKETGYIYHPLVLE
jgi:glycosyltransferase involved in cell wall biosynthesis